MSNFDPSQFVSSDLGIFGLPVSEKEAKIIMIPVPWEVTTSYGRGTSLGPKIIRKASEQVDLFDFETGKAYEAGYFMRKTPAHLLKLSQKMKPKAGQKKYLKQINQACETMTTWVYEQTKEILQQGKIAAVVGGDHSTPLGAIRALAEKHKGQFGVLHIDAHADLREAYQGHTQSHASIMFNVMNEKHQPKKLVQVGIRDFCEEEFDFIQSRSGQIKTFFDIENKRRMIEGTTWSTIAQEIVSELPDKVYISFDIDGLDPALCPNTGTPVAGGLSLDQAFYLFQELHKQKKQIIGFDLNEVSPGLQTKSEWDGNVGARVLYKMCGWAVKTNSKTNL